MIGSFLLTVKASLKGIVVTLLEVKVIYAVASQDDHFHFYSLSTVHMYDLYHIHITSLSSYNGYKLNSQMTCSRRGFIAQLVEHHNGIAEVMGSDSVGASEFILGLLCNCLSCFTTSKITFTCILYPHFVYMVCIIYTSFYSTGGVSVTPWNKHV